MLILLAHQRNWARVLQWSMYDGNRKMKVLMLWSIFLKLNPSNVNNSNSVYWTIMTMCWQRQHAVWSGQQGCPLGQQSTHYQNTGQVVICLGPLWTICLKSCQESTQRLILSILLCPMPQLIHRFHHLRVLLWKLMINLWSMKLPRMTINLGLKIFMRILLHLFNKGTPLQKSPHRPLTNPIKFADLLRILSKTKFKTSRRSQQRDSTTNAMECFIGEHKSAPSYFLEYNLSQLTHPN